MPMSTYLANAVLDHVFKIGAYAVPTNLFLALSTADPGLTGSTIAEPVGNAYAREGINSAFEAAASRANTTDEEIEFAEATGSWGTISHWAIFDASTGGNMLWKGTFATAKAVSSGDVAKVVVGDLDLTIN
jgi:hypothetical protein